MSVRLIEQRSRSGPGGCAGVTLVELLTVITIVGILAMIATPSFERIVAGGRTSEGASSLRGAIELARSEAQVRGDRAAVCRSVSANATSPSCSAIAAGDFAGNDWAAGWIVYAKAAANTGVDFEAGDTLVRRQGALGPGAGTRTMIWAPATTPIVFGWNGIRMSGPVGTFAIDHGTALPAQPTPLASEQARCLLINAAGRIQSTRPTAGSCP